MVKRIKDFRPDYDYNARAEPVASNYYPVTSKISIRDETKDLEFAVLNDRSQGGSSLKNGQVELMVSHRDIQNKTPKHSKIVPKSKLLATTNI